MTVSMTERAWGNTKYMFSETSRNQVIVLGTNNYSRILHLNDSGRKCGRRKLGRPIWKLLAGLSVMYNLRGKPHELDLNSRVITLVTAS